MACETVTMPGGSRAIVCSGRGRIKRCACGCPATAQCDWRMPERRSGTCDADLCASCSTVPAPDKDLCPKHAIAWEQWQARHHAKARRVEGEARR